MRPYVRMGVTDGLIQFMQQTLIILLRERELVPEPDEYEIYWHVLTHTTK